jgi:AcrR family transcriptional regulator
MADVTPPRVVGETNRVLLFHLMPVIAGTRRAVRPLGAGIVVPAPGSNEARVVDAVLACMARWGIQKTTIDDVAREAGLSRATVYRLFPGGKPEIIRTAALVDTARLAAGLVDELSGAADLEDALVRGVHLTATWLAADEALAFLRTHEPEAVEAYLAFDRLDGLFQAAGALVGPVLAPHLPDPARATTAAVWAARLVVSYFLTPADGVDLTCEIDVRRLVRNHLLPGLVPAPGAAVADAAATQIPIHPEPGVPA